MTMTDERTNGRTTVPRGDRSVIRPTAGPSPAALLVVRVREGSVLQRLEAADEALQAARDAGAIAALETLARLLETRARDDRARGQDVRGYATAEAAATAREQAALIQVRGTG